VRADLLVELRSELRAQPAHVDVDRAGAPVVVVAPDLLQQLGPGEHPARVLGEVLQQLELLVGQVERAPADLGGVGGLVDDDVTGADLGGDRLERLVGDQRAPDGQPQPGLDLGRTRGDDEDVVHAPLGGDRRQAALGQHQQQGSGHAGGAQQPAQRSGRRELAASVDEDDVGRRGLDQGGGLGGQHAHLVPEQAEGGQDLGAGGEVVGQEQQTRHAGTSLR
jgi:hypothetical protein